MNINIEKTISEYGRGFFSTIGAGERLREQSAAGEIGCLFIRDGSVKNSYEGYDKMPKPAFEKDNGCEPGIGAKGGVQEFLKNAIKTLKDMVTEEDYSQLATLGIIAEKDDLGTIVTVYERIQIQLAAYGDGDIATSIDISGEKIDKVLKSQGLANSVKKAESVVNIDDNAKEYLLKNNLEPTVDNVYMSVHTGEGSSAGIRAISDEEWRQLKPQIEKMLEKNGMAAGSRELSNAKWLLERDMELSTDNLIKLEKLNELSETKALGGQDMEYVKANMIMAELFGMGAGNAYMTKGWIDRDTAREAAETLKMADINEVSYIVENDYKLNIANLERYLRQSGYGNRNPEKSEGEALEKADRGTYKNAEENRKNRKNRYINILKQAKAVLTAEGMLHMQKLGVDIRYTDLEKLTRLADMQKEKYASTFFNEPSKEKTASFISIMDIMNQMSSMPAASIGRTAGGEMPFNIKNVYETGRAMKAAFERAGETYEAVGTQVRSDLGDSIGKAFKNADALIEETGLKADDMYRRAVRILGYNQMEVTRDNIILIAEKAAEVDKVIRNITPKTAAYLIENGIDPLTEDIETLNDRLEAVNNAIGADANEEYGKYLWKLQKSGNISKEEREAYIELYRSIKIIQRMDTRAVGAVAREGAAFTIENLLSAEKSRARYGTDINVDDDTGYYEGRLIKSRLSDILSNMRKKEGEALNANSLPKINIEAMWQQCASEESRREADRINKQYEQYKLKDIYKMAEYSEKAIYNLMEDGLTPSIENIAAAAELMRRGSRTREMLKEKSAAWSRLHDSFNNEALLNKEYEAIENEASELYGEALGSQEIYDRESSKELSEEIEPSTKQEPLTETSEYRNMAVMARYIRSAAENRSYYVPLDIEGRDVMVKIRFENAGEGLSGIRVSVSEEFGDIEARVVFEKGKKPEGYIKTENEYIRREFMDWQEGLSAEPPEEGEDKEAGLGGAYYTRRQLYDISKSLLKGLKVWGEMSIKKIES